MSDDIDGSNKGLTSFVSSIPSRVREIMNPAGADVQEEEIRAVMSPWMDMDERVDLLQKARRRQTDPASERTLLAMSALGGLGLAPLSNRILKGIETGVAKNPATNLMIERVRRNDAAIVRGALSTLSPEAQRRVLDDLALEGLLNLEDVAVPSSSARSRLKSLSGRLPEVKSVGRLAPASAILAQTNRRIDVPGGAGIKSIYQQGNLMGTALADNLMKAGQPKAAQDVINRFVRSDRSAANVLTRDVPIALKNFPRAWNKNPMQLAMDMNLDDSLAKLIGVDEVLLRESLKPDLKNIPLDPITKLYKHAPSPRRVAKGLVAAGALVSPFLIARNVIKSRREEAENRDAARALLANADDRRARSGFGRTSIADILKAQGRQAIVGPVEKNTEDFLKGANDAMAVYDEMSIYDNLLSLANVFK